KPSESASKPSEEPSNQPSISQEPSEDDSISTTTRVSVHDPSVFLDPKSGRYYIFGSHLAQASSEDLRNWQPEGIQGYENTSLYALGEDDLTGTYYIQSVLSNLYLDVTNGSGDNGTNIRQWSYNGSQAQQFKLVSAGGGYYYIFTGASGFNSCVDVENGKADNGTNIMEWEYWGGEMQKYKLEKQSDGSYAILTNASQTKSALDVWDQSKDAGGDIRQYEFWGGEGQKWRLIDAQKTDSRTRETRLENALAPSFAWAGFNDQDSKGGYAVWAPDMIYNPNYVWNDGSKGAYMLYYCTSSTYIRSCIGYAVSKSVTGPFQYQDTVIYSGFTSNDNYITTESDLGYRTVNTSVSHTNVQKLLDSGKIQEQGRHWYNSNGSFNNQYCPNAIDPNITFDTDGKLWMTYGSWSGGIYQLELDTATGEPIYPGKNSGDTDPYFGKHIAGGFGKSGEAPYIRYDAQSGYYELYVTYGGLTSDGGYHMRLYRSKDINGPYKDAAGRNAVYDKDTNQAERGVKLFGNYQFSCLSQGYKSGGHNSAFIDNDGQHYLVYHTRFDDGYEFHEVRVHQQFLNEDGWPVTAVYENLGSKISENGYSLKEMAGTYEFVNHETDAQTKNVGMLQTKQITLNEDGTISGDVSGNWSYTDGTYFCQMQVNGVTYKGIFFKQKKESDDQEKVMTFSLIGTNNESIWGSKK
ncbi:MAG: RICIN domain-containing protein, partial [Lachnospiraceae bacterium]